MSRLPSINHQGLLVFGVKFDTLHLNYIWVVKLDVVDGYNLLHLTFPCSELDFSFHTASWCHRREILQPAPVDN